MNVRERTIQQHRAVYSPWACDDEQMTGRARPMEICTLRTDFQRDRDRIIHCKAFRRMKHKTQCFLAPEDDHFRTRLTHTMEVAQIARTISRALSLNEDLTEAIALGHDLGHTPFGHMGERILNRLTPGGFAHEQQSLRVVEVLENDGVGLNLTEAVRDGIAQHPSHGTPKTLEGEVVSLSDRIAYINHDIDDATRAGVLKQEEIPKEILGALGYTHGDRIDKMIGNVVEASEGQTHVRMTPEIYEATMALRAFMFRHVYTRDIVQREERKAEFMLESLFDHYRKHPEQMPAEFLAGAQEDGVEQAVCDYIAGMTDNYAVHKFTDLFIPRHEILLG